MNTYPGNPLSLVADEYGTPWYLRLGVLWPEDVPMSSGLTALARPLKPLLVFEFAGSDIALMRWIANN